MKDVIEARSVLHQPLSFQILVKDNGAVLTIDYEARSERERDEIVARICFLASRAYEDGTK